MKLLVYIFSLIRVSFALPLIVDQDVVDTLLNIQLEQHTLTKAPTRAPDFVLPYEDYEQLKRASDILYKRQSFLYGPSLIGNTSYFPTGVLGDALVQQHIDTWLYEANQIVSAVDDESVAVLEDLNTAGGFHNVQDYQMLYEGHWEKSVPTGIAPGMISNGSHDLLFSMERLSTNPYAVRRLHPTEDKLPFDLDSSITREITGFDLDELHQSGRLFYVDHSYQANYPTFENRFAAASSAYFYIDSLSGDFLPLSIRTNVGANLVYTPLDSNEDWLLAKTMFNMNDLFHGQIFHLANSHAVCEIIHLAALRTLSTSHPVLGLLDHLMHMAYAIRPMGEKVLFNPGGYFDNSFAITNRGVRKFATEFYSKVGSFQANYFLEDVVSRGLVNCTYGPMLKSFPFFQDANKIHSSMNKFMRAYVLAYYNTDEHLEHDMEVQSWIHEANNEASVIGFPTSPLARREVLIDILTQIAFLAGVSHHVLNSGEPVATSGVLPFHPSALYSPPPATKGIKNLMPFLTPVEDAVRHVALLARFNRPSLEDTNETLLYMFSSPKLLQRCRPEITRAAGLFQNEMELISELIANRKFDSDGLSQGMPFVWRGIDPQRIPYFLSV